MTDKIGPLFSVDYDQPDLIAPLTAIDGTADPDTIAAPNSTPPSAAWRRQFRCLRKNSFVDDVVANNNQSIALVEDKAKVVDGDIVIQIDASNKMTFLGVPDVSAVLDDIIRNA